MFKRIIFCILGLISLISIAGATSSLTIGTPTYSSSVLKDDTFTLEVPIEAASVSSQITVTITLTDNTNGVTVTSATKTISYSTNGTQNIQWSLRANNPGIYSNPFTIQATANDGGTASPLTSTTSLTIRDRPVLTVNVSQNATTVSPLGFVQLNYTITNVASIGAASATDLNTSLTSIPAGFTVISPPNYTVSSLSAGGSQTSGYFIVKASSTSSSYDINMSVISAQGDNIVKGWNVVVSSDGGGNVSGTVAITIASPANNSINTTGYVNVTATLNNTGTAQYLNWNGVNYSMSPSGSQAQGTVFYRNMTGLLSGNHTFRVYASDSNTSNVSGTRVVTVNRTTTDTTIGGSINTTTHIVNSTIGITAPSGNATVTIPNGTNASAGGAALTSITIDSTASVDSAYVAALGNSTPAGENLSVGPAGAIFSPDIQIRFNYTDAQIAAAGINESRLRVKFYNTTAGTWVEQTPYTLNTTGNYIIANVSHFSIFALVGEAAPVLTTITISPVNATLTIGDDQEFNATAKDQSGTVMEGINITWASNNTSIGTVTPLNGLTDSYGNATVTFTAITAGTAAINATNGSISGNATVINADTVMNLTSGWNLVSVPFNLTNKKPFAGTAVDKVFYYNATASIPVSDPNIDPLKSYWVNNSAQGTIRIALFNNTGAGAGGSGAPTQSISLANGWNMAGPTGMVSRNATVMFGSLGSNLWRVASYNSTGNEYVIYTNSDTATNKVSDLTTEPKVGYWVFVTGDSRYDGDGSIR